MKWTKTEQNRVREVKVIRGQAEQENVLQKKNRY